MLSTIPPQVYCLIRFSPPAPFIFELLDAEGENIFTSESYEMGDLIIERTDISMDLEFKFISENNLNVIEIGSIGWTSEQVNLSFQLDNNEIFTFSVNAERLNEDCCSFTKYSNISIESASFELDNQTGFYKVFVE